MSKAMGSCLGLALMTLLAGCMTRPDPQMVENGLGSRIMPIKADMPPGQRDYLARLRCPLGDRPEATRLGSYGLQSDGHVIDGYVLSCRGKPDRIVFMDMYHPSHVEMAAPDGFTILPTP